MATSVAETIVTEKKITIYDLEDYNEEEDEDFVPVNDDEDNEDDDEEMEEEDEDEDEDEIGDDIGVDELKELAQDAKDHGTPLPKEVEDLIEAVKANTIQE